MPNVEEAYRDFGPIGDARGAGFPRGGREVVLPLVIREARAALEREREQAAIEAQDVLSQADEALVMG